MAATDLKPLLLELNDRKRLKNFIAWLRASGAEIYHVNPTHEAVRFIVDGRFGVLLKNKAGRINYAQGEARDAVRRFFDRSPLSDRLPPANSKWRKTEMIVSTLLQRDGDSCFYCGLPVGGDESVEHLLPRAHGGPDHISNLALAHSQCNARAGHLSIAEKVALRDELRRKAKEEGR
jgi:hypothetical protein